MWGIVLEEIILVSIINHTGESEIVSSRIFLRVVLHLGMKFTSNREDFYVEMYIFLSLVPFGPCGRGANLGNKWNNWSSTNICWALSRPISLVWLILESNNVCYFSLGNYTVSAQYRLHILGHGELFSTSPTSSWVFTIPCTIILALFYGFSIPLFLFRPFIVIILWMVWVHSIKFTFRIFLGASSPILAIFGNIFFYLLTRQDSILFSHST